MTAYDTLQKKYELEISLHNTNERLEELQEKLPELKAKKREADAAVLNYGSLRQLFDRLSGKGDDEKAALERSARAAAAALSAAQRERDGLMETAAGLQQEWESLGETAALKSRLSAEEQAHFARLEAGLHAEKALHFLRKCRKELEQAQYLARNPMMQVGQGYQENVHKANAGALADQCRQQLEAICDCGFPFPIHAYIQNPMGYIVSAQRFGDQDLMNNAQKALHQTEAALKELLLQLTE